MLESSLLQCAQNSFENPTSSDNSHDTGLQGFHFIIDFCSTMTHDKKSYARSSEMLNRAYQPFLKECRKILKKKDPNRCERHLPSMLKILSATVWLPETLLSLSSEERVVLFQTSHLLASLGSQQADHHNQVQLSSIELALQQSILSLAHFQIRDDWLGSLTRIFEKDSQSATFNSDLNSAVHLLLYFPVEAIPREMRERLLNNLTDHVLNMKSSSPRHDFLFLLARLCSVANPAAMLVSDRDMRRASD